MSSADFAPVDTSRTTPAVLSRILDSGGLATIFAGFKSAGVLSLEHFAGEAQVMPQAIWSTRPSITAECDWLVSEYIHKTCLSFYCHKEAAVAKNGAFIEWMQQPNTHQPVLFRVNISFKKT
jgi:hypothetical protein